MGSFGFKPCSVSSLPGLQWERTLPTHLTQAASEGQQDSTSQLSHAPAPLSPEEAAGAGRARSRKGRCAQALASTLAGGEGGNGSQLDVPLEPGLQGHGADGGRGHGEWPGGLGVGKARGMGHLGGRGWPDRGKGLKRRQCRETEARREGGLRAGEKAEAGLQPLSWCPPKLSCGKRTPR